ncbi:MAG: GIY-YIG nuclease family protein [Candidatus Halichondribacter symbioticus]
MNIDKLTPPTKNKTNFRFSSSHKVPQKSGCYVITNYDGDIFYIGQAVDIHRRFEEHLKNPKKTSITPKGRAFWFHWLEWDAVKLNSLERGWLNTYSATIGELPIMNSQNPPV